MLINRRSKSGPAKNTASLDGFVKGSPDINRRIKQGSIIILSAFMLLACQTDRAPESQASTETSLATGIIVDGPVIQALVAVADSHGNTVATTVSRENASYDVNIPADAQYPLIIN